MDVCLHGQAQENVCDLTAVKPLLTKHCKISQGSLEVKDTNITNTTHPLMFLIDSPQSATHPKRSQLW